LLVLIFTVVGSDFQSFGSHFHSFRFSFVQFEDALRNALGTGSYMLYTVDKLVQQIVKQLHLLSSDTQDPANQKLLAQVKRHV
jgi:histone deacetylase complex regulatory component SIN3